MDRRKVLGKPSKEELEELVETYGFSETGRIFGVSNNAVRKWMKSDRE